MENVVTCAQGEIIVGREFRVFDDLFTYPIESSRINIFIISELKEHWPLSSIQFKGFQIPLTANSNSKYAVFPLIMECHE